MTTFVVEYNSQKYKIRPNACFRVGRVEAVKEITNDLVVDCQTVSRRHAELQNTGSNLVLRDLESPNRTALNGEYVEPNKDLKLNIGDRIKFAEDELELVVIKKKKKVEQAKDSESKEEDEQKQEEERERSRDKKPKVELSESTKKMLKGIQKYKTKEDKIKFLKLMGLKNAEEQWDAIEAQIKKTSKAGSFDKANEEIERQFQHSRMGHTKKGLGSAN